MTTVALTDRQREVLRFVIEFVGTRGHGPSIRELARGLQINSPNGIAYHLRVLAKKGHLVPGPGLARAVVPTALLPLIRRAADEVLAGLERGVIVSGAE